jgi:uncharacterized protein YraI
MSAKLASLTTLAAIALAASTSLAFAAPNAVMTDDSNVYKSNSSASAVVNDVSEDDDVTVIKCTTSWCFIKIPGPDGWVKKKYLANLDDSGDPVDTSPFNFSMTLGSGGPVISFGNPPAPPAPPPSSPKACFFADPNFGGASACYTPGDSDNDMSITGPGYDNNISSIKLTGGASVKVCLNAGFSGGCATFSSDKPFLGGYDNAISSFQVY